MKYYWRLYFNKRDSNSPDSSRMVWRSDQNESDGEFLDRAQWDHKKIELNRAGDTYEQWVEPS